MQRALTSSQIEYQLTVMNGPDKGAMYRLVARKVTIGRGAECDIVLREDPKVSRMHAQITITGDQIEIEDISDRNRIFVNGDDSPRHVLRNNAVIQLGDTKLQFKLGSSAGAMQPLSPRNELNAAANFIREKAAGFSRKRQRAGGRPSLMPLIVGLLILLGVGYKMNEKPAPAPNPAKVGSEEEILRSTASVDQELAALKAEREKEESGPHRQAKPHFIKGFRDYANGQYERAAESFKACLALVPSHKGCQQYYNASVRELGQLINDQILLGLKYKSQNQFAACANAFQNVMFTVKVPTDPRYKEAKANKEYCIEKQKQGGRF